MEKGLKKQDICVYVLTESFCHASETPYCNQLYSNKYFLKIKDSTAKGKKIFKDWDRRLLGQESHLGFPNPKVCRRPHLVFLNMLLHAWMGEKVIPATQPLLSSKKLTVQCSLLSQTHTPAQETNGRQVLSHTRLTSEPQDAFTAGSPWASPQRSS